MLKYGDKMLAFYLGMALSSLVGRESHVVFRPVKATAYAW